MFHSVPSQAVACVLLESLVKSQGLGALLRVALLGLSRKYIVRFNDKLAGIATR